MAGTAKQRSKKDKAAEAAAKERKEESLEEQLDRAEVAVRKARDATAYLHDQWRTHLYRISFLVLLVSFHQCRLPMNECMTNIKVCNVELLYARTSLSSIMNRFIPSLFLLSTACQ